MRNLATFVHVAVPAADFNSTFYSTVATIIPVLFLALAVQGTGTAYQNLLDSGSKLTRHLFGVGERRQGAVNAVLMLSGGMVFQLVQLAAFGILVLATIGEVTAIIALSDQSAGGNTRFWVFWSVVLLTVLVAAPPLVALGKFQYDAMQSTTRRPAAHVHDKPDGEEAHGRHQ